MNEAEMWMTVGIGLNREVRDFLGRLKLTDPTLRWHEGSGWLTRRYDVVGSSASIAAIERAIASFKARTASPNSG